MPLTLDSSLEDERQSWGSISGGIELSSLGSSGTVWEASHGDGSKGCTEVGRLVSGVQVTHLVLWMR